jgi:hypothetical protein
MRYGTDTIARMAIEGHLDKMGIKHSTISSSSHGGQKVNIVIWITEENTVTLQACQGEAKKYARWMDEFITELSLEDVLPLLQETNILLGSLSNSLFVEEVEKEKKARVKKFLLETRLRLGI